MGDTTQEIVSSIQNDEESKVLSKIVLYLVIPCVIVNAFQVDYTAQTAKGLMIAFVASVILQIILLIIVAVMGKVLSLNCGRISQSFRRKIRSCV